jgi:hypothetical protein
MHCGCLEICPSCCFKAVFLLKRLIEFFGTLLATSPLTLNAELS